jgi:hypothetical protein
MGEEAWSMVVGPWCVELVAGGAGGAGDGDVVDGEEDGAGVGVRKVELLCRGADGSAVGDAEGGELAVGVGEVAAVGEEELVARGGDEAEEGAEAGLGEAWVFVAHAGEVGGGEAGLVDGLDEVAVGLGEEVGAGDDALREGGGDGSASVGWAGGGEGLGVGFEVGGLAV